MSRRPSGGPATRVPGDPLTVAGAGGWPGPGKLPSGNPGGTCMANRPVNTGSGGGAPPPPPPPTPPPPPPRPPPAPPPRAARTTRAGRDPRPSKLAWLPYLIVLAGTAAGMLVAWHGSTYAGRGASLIGAPLLAAAPAR